MHHETNDVLALLGVCLQFSGMAAVSLRIFLLRRWQTGCRRFGWAGVLLLLAAAWLALNFFDVSSIFAALGNDVDDIPAVTTLRVTLFGLWLWVAFVLVWRLAKEQLDD